MRKGRLALFIAVLALAISAVVALGTAKPAGAFIHEMIGASCSTNGAPEPPGQSGEAGNSTSFIRALQATGVISSITFDSTTGLATIHFDFTRPNAKFVSSGVDFQIPGTNIVLSPAPKLDPDAFAAFAHCANLR